MKANGSIQKTLAVVVLGTMLGASACSQDHHPPSQEKPPTNEESSPVKSEPAGDASANTATVALPSQPAPAEASPEDVEALEALLSWGADEELARKALQLRAPAHAGGLGSEAEIGDVLYYLVRGTTEGGVWGTDVYTFDSAIEAAAVHAGTLAAGEAGLVRVEVLPGQDTYEASTYHGVSSEGYGTYGLSYSLTATPDNAPEERARIDAEAAAMQKQQDAQRAAFTKKAGELSAKPWGEPLSAEALTVGQVLHFTLTGTTRGGSVWGSNPYTFDSDIRMAVVHAGLVKPRERAIIQLEVVPNPASYEGSFANGIKSETYGEYGPAVKLSRVLVE